MSRRPLSAPKFKASPKAPPEVRIPPTPELVLHRNAMAMGDDPAKTTTPLDTALSRRHISREQHAAGKQFGYLWRHGGARNPHVTAQELDRDRRGGHQDGEATQREKRLRSEFNSARNHVVNRHGTYGLRVLTDFVIIERWYWWVMTPKGNIKDLPPTQRPVMKTALDVLSTLAKHFDRDQGKVRHTIIDERDYA